MSFSSPLDNQQTDRMTLDEWLITDKNATYIVRMEGDAMRDAHILDGDYLLVLRTNKVSPGDIVLAIQEGESLVRYFHKSHNRAPYLSSTDKDKVSDTSFSVEGKITGVIRKIESTAVKATR